MPAQRPRDIELSFWLLAFSVFLFLSLGFVKRYAELYDARKAGKLGGHGRGYGADDLSLIMNLGTASGYCAVVVIALYINSADSIALYHHHKTMWLICPLMLFWISRVWMLTARGHMHDDPVVFALRDRISLLVLGADRTAAYCCRSEARAMSTGVSWGRWPRYEQRIIPLTSRFDPLPQAEPMLVFGNGRSYGDVCLNAGGTLLAARGLDRFISLRCHERRSRVRSRRASRARSSA